MKFKEILLILFVLIYIFECKGEISSGKKDALTVEDSLSSNIIFTEQKISYFAPLSGSVYLVWITENYSLEESVLWNEDTKLTDSKLFIPMHAQNDTFNVTLKIPVGTIFQYYFWITKNKQGAYQDFWDLQASGKTTVKDGTPVMKNAVYSKVEEKKESRLLSLAWILFFLLVFVFGVLTWFQKRWLSEYKISSNIEKVFFIGLSLALFHSLARSEIININPINVLNDFRIIAKIIKGSISDFLFVSALTGTFVITLRLLNNKKVENVIYLIFIFLALFSTLVSFINISIVVYLGKPFNYQWLYYSDFLGNNEAKTALQQNLSAGIAIIIILLCISMFILAGVLRITYRILTINKRLKYITYSFIIFVLIGLILTTFKTKATWTEGQSENAITAMVRSVFEAYSNSSFFSAEIPKEMEPFNPSQGTKIETPLAPFKEHNVKNVLFIVLESAGAAYFDGYGGPYQLSPNLNKYASQSLIFDNMYAHAPSTNKTLISILGSIYPYVSYQSITQEKPDIEHPTLSSVLKNKGYKTSFFTSADLRFQNCNEFLAHRGFDVVEDFKAIKCFKEFQLESSDYVGGNGIDDMCLVDRFTSWIDEDLENSFFSMLWTVQGHYPYFFAGHEEDFGVSNYNHNRYLNCLKHNDELIGKIMQSLEDRGLAATTLVIVVGDHGEAFGQHKQYGHGTAIYEENLKVPLYFINSTLFRGERKFDIAGMKDIASTALSIIDVDIPKNWQGRNLLDTNSDEVFYFAPWSDFLFGYRKDNMKYIFNETRNTVEVFDISKDPQEKTNLRDSLNKDQLVYARNKIGAWVQYQDKFIKELLNK